jgi:chromosomal replication initiation ATPase DnaA
MRSYRNKSQLYFRNNACYRKRFLLANFLKSSFISENSVFFHETARTERALVRCSHPSNRLRLVRCSRRTRNQVAATTERQRSRVSVGWTTHALAVIADIRAAALLHG